VKIEFFVTSATPLVRRNSGKVNSREALSSNLISFHIEMIFPLENDRLDFILY
jgi:hypothetical protein